MKKTYEQLELEIEGLAGELERQKYWYEIAMRNKEMADNLIKKLDIGKEGLNEIFHMTFPDNYQAMADATLKRMEEVK